MPANCVAAHASALAQAVVSGCLEALWSADSEMVGKLVVLVLPPDALLAPLHILQTACVCVCKERDKMRERGIKSEIGE